jgi:transposase
MTRGPKGYSEEFRREAVRLTESGSRPMSQIARELGIHLETLRGWRREMMRARDESQDGVTGASTTVPSLEEENSRLRRENERLREEREILKKATAFFAKDAR